MLDGCEQYALELYAPKEPGANDEEAWWATEDL